MDADAKNPARRESTAELLADWRAAERDAVAAREAARIATLALEAARAAEEAALETETAANAASEAVERALQAAGSARRAASQAAEAAKIFTTGWRHRGVSRPGWLLAGRTAVPPGRARSDP
jgi:hypothetical protein